MNPITSTTPTMPHVPVQGSSSGNSNGPGVGHTTARPVVSQTPHRSQPRPTLMRNASRASFTATAITIGTSVATTAITIGTSRLDPSDSMPEEEVAMAAMAAYHQERQDLAALGGKFGMQRLIPDVKKQTDNMKIQNAQEPDMAQEIAEASAMPMPANIKPGEFTFMPTDQMAVLNQNGTKGTRLLEANGQGYGNFTTADAQIQRVWMHTHSLIARELLNEPNPVIVIACSGREDPPKFAASVKMIEKAMIAKSMVDVFDGERGEGTTKVIGVDSFDKNAIDADGQDIPGKDKNGIGALPGQLDDGAYTEGGATIVVGYTAQLANAITVENGVPYLHGRRVHALVNDRLIENVNNLNANNRLDPELVICANRSSLAAADKGVAGYFYNQYSQEGGLEFPQFTGITEISQASGKEGVLKELVRRLKNGEHVVVKPSGTGNGNGVIPYFAHEYNKDLGDDEQIVLKEQVEKQYDLVHSIYGDRGGDPYTLQPYFVADRIDKPGSAFHTMKVEFRAVTYGDYTDPENPMVKTHIPILKVDALSKLEEAEPGYEGETMEFSDGKLYKGSPYSKDIASVSKQVKNLGGSPADYMLPVNMKTLDLLGYTKEDAIQLARATAGYTCRVLEGVDEIQSVSQLPVMLEAQKAARQENNANQS